MKFWTAIKVFHSFILSYNGSKNAVFLTAEETLDMIMSKKLSLIRYGDGEFNYIKGKDVSYQKQDQRLNEYLKRILDEYIENQTNKKYILAMPGDFFSCKGDKIIKRKEYLLSWSFARRVFNKNYDKRITYGDAFLFAKENQRIYEKLWNFSGIDNIIFLHNDHSYFEKLKKNSSKKFFFIKILDKNAFADYDRLLNEVREKIRISNKDRTIVIVSAGPTAKALVYDLSKEGIWAIDAGHCFCEPLSKMGK